jgi:hypothetical protein
MKRFALLVLALGTIALTAAALPSAAASRHPFRGVWRGVDFSDGSNEVIKFSEEGRSRGEVFAIRGRDDRTGDWCEGNGPAEMSAIGVLQSPTHMLVSYVWWCLPPGEGLYPANGSDPQFVSGEYTYDAATDTLTDEWGTVYRRSQ